jgi:hypothetical protein
VKCRTPLPSSTAPVLIKDVSPFGNPGYLFTPGKETLKNRASTYPLDGMLLLTSKCPQAAVFAAAAVVGMKSSFLLVTALPHCPLQACPSRSGPWRW